MTGPARIVELWPSLTEKQRVALIDIVEAAALRDSLYLTREEAAALARSKEDFSAGRAISFDEAEMETDGFLRGLRPGA
ncbi:hypothetical protein OGR47_07765 [Methylocystis sp. MJC1]|jgi:hypothetical protein|uniref:hypothetical protein n=1 Tax=Methylocystis sp. MJC1 TaxID=2654282 RepID=UPI0013E9AAB8|nr:hypothetical protein [Methylocystis sp. MJC1]KAF2989361.1 hypothetical protein MJC1_03511 [Methylocystis sp. MJC1]MBU6526888.1 hypothetical protein [Methylocystis sp. MJC1]UZX13324.1 hypothetical protein OGR47_07765 [Methylocystis sp. MJC1]